MIVALAAGCGTVTMKPGTLTNVATPHSSGPAGHSTPAAGNRAAALAFGQQLLAGLVLPPGTRPTRVSVVPQPLRDAFSPSAGSVEVGRIYLAPQPMSQVFTFLRAHPPRGVTLLATGQLGNVGPANVGPANVGPASAEASADDVQWTARELPSGIYATDLDLAIGAESSGSALITAYAHVTWFPARTAVEQLTASRFQRITFTADVLNPKPHSITRTYTSAALITRVVNILNGLHAAPNVAMSCPAELVTYQVTLAATDASSVVVTASGCLFLAITFGGKAQPSLWDQSNAIASLASQLLGTAQRSVMR